LHELIKLAKIMP